MWQEIIALHSPQYRRKLLIQLGLNASVCVCVCAMVSYAVGSIPQAAIISSVSLYL